MGYREVEAIVLRAELSGEADRRVALLVQSGALLHALAPAAARSRRRFGAALQPGARISARLSERRVPVLEEARLLDEPPAGHPLERLYATAHVLELARLFAREGAEDSRLYRLLAAVIAALRSETDVAVTARYMEAWALRLAGLLDDSYLCGVCGRELLGAPAWLAAEAGFTCAEHRPSGGFILDAEALAWLALSRREAVGALPPVGAGADRELAFALQTLITSFAGAPLFAWREWQRFLSLERERPS